MERSKAEVKKGAKDTKESKEETIFPFVFSRFYISSNIIGVVF
jgi:hypothetical protein